MARHTAGPLPASARPVTVLLGRGFNIPDSEAPAVAVRATLCSSPLQPSSVTALCNWWCCRVFSELLLDWLWQAAAGRALLIWQQWLLALKVSAWLPHLLH